MSRAGDELGAFVLLLLVLGVMVAMVVGVASAASMAIAKLCLWLGDGYVAWRAARAAAAAAELGRGGGCREVSRNRTRSIREPQPGGEE